MKYLSFVEEAVMNPDYAGYIGGRVEVRDDAPDRGQGSYREIRFLTKRVEDFANFRDYWDLRDVTDAEVAVVEIAINERYMEPLR